MNEENDQLPLARMMTISRPSFWTYFMVCVVLFACYMFRKQNTIADWTVPSLIAFGVFAVLFLELLSQRIKNSRAAVILINTNYILEAASTIIFLFMVFGK